MTLDRQRHAGDDTAANRTLDALMALSPDDLQNVLGIAREYADHNSLKGSVPAGTRLLRQIEFALDEYAALPPRG